MSFHERGRSHSRLQAMREEEERIAMTGLLAFDSPSSEGAQPPERDGQES